MVKNSDFDVSLDSNPYKFQHYDISDFSVCLKVKQFPKKGLTLGMDHEETSVMGYRTLFEASGIHHSNTALQITHDMSMNGHFMFYSISHLIGASGRIIRLTPRTAASGTN